MQRFFDKSISQLANINSMCTMWSRWNKFIHILVSVHHYRARFTCLWCFFFNLLSIISWSEHKFTELIVMRMKPSFFNLEYQLFAHLSAINNTQFNDENVDETPISCWCAALIDHSCRFPVFFSANIFISTKMLIPTILLEEKVLFVVRTF